MRQIIVKTHNQGQGVCHHCIDISQDDAQELTVGDLIGAIQETLQYPAEGFSLIGEGNKYLNHQDFLCNLNTPFLETRLRLFGGKGGFGSLLRSKTSKGKKVRDFGACRDLLGRRIRHANNQQEVEEWERRREEQEAKLAADLEQAERSATNQLQSSHQGKASKGQVDEKLVSKIDRCSSSISQSLKMIAAKKRKQKLENSGKRSPEIKSSDLKAEVCCSGSTPISTKKLKRDNSQASNEEEKMETNENGQKQEEEFKQPKLVTSSQEESKTAKQGGKLVSDSNAAASCDTIGSEKKNQEPKMREKVKTKNQQEQEQEEVKEKRKNKVETVSSANEETKSFDKVDLKVFESIDQLATIGGDHLKAELKRLGLKCGGTPQMRAERLWNLKTCPLEKLPKKLFAK